MVDLRFRQREGCSPSPAGRSSEASWRPAKTSRAQSSEATDRKIHDALLIAAAFCMYNRYVDGLATWQPADRDAYRDTGEQLAREG